MIKKFSEFINESKNLNYDNNSGVYGDSLFESITSELMDDVNDAIYEGKISFTEENMLNEGFFTNLFKGAAKKAEVNVDDASAKKEYFQKLAKAATSGAELIKYGLEIKKSEISENVWEYINTLCEDAVELCEKLTKAEEDTKQGITKKLAETKEAIAEFAQKAKETFEKIAENSKNTVADCINAMRYIIAKLAEISKNALVTLGKGACMAACLPFVLIYSTYKSAKALCTKLLEKAKEVKADALDAIDKYGAVISEWFKNQLQSIKETVSKLAKNAKDESEKMIKTVTKAYLYVVEICGLVVDKASTAVKDAYNSFIESAKDYSDMVKSYISDRCDTITNWTKQKSGEFADSVTNVWNNFKDKVTQCVAATKDAAERLKEYSNNKVGEFEDWTDMKKKSFAQSIIAYAVKNWGADEVKGWI